MNKTSAILQSSTSVMGGRNSNSHTAASLPRWWQAVRNSLINKSFLMTKKLSLKINIDNPCLENWELMKISDDGKFCNKCQKTVIDMTLWDEKKFIDFFNQHQKHICGRLYENQLNTIYNDKIITQRKNYNYEKAFALIISFFTLQNISAQTQIQKNSIQNVISNNITDTNIISGRITGESSGALNRASIDFNGKTYYSDSSGHFEINIENQNIKNGIIVFNYGDFVQEIRNYNIEMKSTTYDIQMQKPSLGQRIIAGGISPNFYLPSDYKDNFVTINGVTLDFKTKKILENFATLLKNNPDFEIALQTYYSNDKKLSIQKANTVKKYLVDKYGISTDRLLIVEPKKITINSDKNKIYFLPPEEK